MTDWAPVVICGGLATAAYGRISMGVLTSFPWVDFRRTCPLPSRFGSWGFAFWIGDGSEVPPGCWRIFLIEGLREGNSGGVGNGLIR